MLELSGLSKTFYTRTNEARVINNLSLRVAIGKTFGFLGPNGAGKTTTVKMIAGMLFPDTGKVLVSGEPASSLKAKRQIGFMSENPQFYNHLNAEETLNFVAKLFEIDEKTSTKRSKQLLDKVGLKTASQKMVKKFSKGMLQRLAFACALINNPKLLVLDEPLDGLDPLGRLDFKKLLLELKQQGVTIFFSSHILSDVEEICDEIAIINKGKIIAQGEPKKLMGKKHQSLEELFVSVVRNND